MVVRYMLLKLFECFQQTMPCCDKESGSNFRQQQKHSKNFLIFAKKSFDTKRTIHNFLFPFYNCNLGKYLMYHMRTFYIMIWC